MTNPDDLDDVLPDNEHPHPDHRAHGKTDKHLDDDVLEARTEQERAEVAADQARRDGRPDPNRHDDLPSATD